ALQLEPQDPGLRLALANAYFTRANRAKNSELREVWIREGRGELELILRRNPRHVEALRTKALSHGLDPGFLGDDGRILHPELLPKELRGDLEPAQIFAGLAYGAALQAEAKGNPGRARSLLEAATEMNPRHALAQIGLAKASLADGQLRKAKNHLRLALEHAIEAAELDQLHALLTGKEGTKLLPKGENTWSFLGTRLFEAGRHGLARKAFLAAAASDPKEQAEWTRRAQLADERERPYEREFASLSAPNPMAATLYEALKRQGIPDEAIDAMSAGDKNRRLSHREIYDYVGSHLSDPEVRAALREEGLEIPKGGIEQVRRQGFAGFMAERLSAEARDLQKDDPGSAEATDKLERALYFDPENVERHLALAAAYSAEGHEGAAAEVLVGAARLAPQDRALSQRLLSTHEKA
ncbi:MAG TPA: tetratricopeptide repeat protein, partial [bacterium]|nr:tetratricopeptide repeat protein [bacterium]